MCSRETTKGTSFETLVLPLFRVHYGPDVHRLGKQGAADKGDIWLPGDVPFVIECKNEQSYAGKLSGWITEAHREAACAEKPYGFVVHKRRGSTMPEKQYVTAELGAFLGVVAPLVPVAA